MLLNVFVENVDTAVQKLLDAGATIINPVKDEFYGDRVGQVMDPFGYKWMITTHKKDISFEEMQKQSDLWFQENNK